MEQNNSLNVGFLGDFITVLEEDVNDRLTVVRMVSDSVTKGMVSAVEQDADEIMKAKESELDSLKRSLDNELTVDFIRYGSLEDVCVKHDEMKESVTDEFMRLRKQIEGLKSCKLTRNGSCYEMVGLSDILKDEYDLEKTVDNLEMMMSNMSKLVDSVVTFSKNSLNEWQHKHEMKAELEDMVIQSSTKCIQEQFQEAESQNELDETKAKLSKAEKRLVSDEEEIRSLNQRIVLAMEEMKTLTDYKNMVFDVSEEKLRFMSEIEAKEREYRKQMEAIVVLVDELTANFVDFECRVTWDVKNNNTRLENLRKQLSSLVTEANATKNTRILYKQKLEMESPDLQMAKEVDCLHDEVDKLLGVLEKMHIALDHYWPVLKHYPGGIEFAELLRRELSGDSL